MPRVLIVDDDALVLRIERVTLTRAGFEVSAATSVDEANGELARATPDLVLVDLHLGSESGLDLVRTLKASGYAGRVVVVSGQNTADGEVQTAGADGFLAKPFTPAELVAAVRARLPLG
ncbi:MAG: response regulator [Sandaracinaceae bacterium]|nr:response regulator [Sandaracinaceae bacterium]